MKAPFQITQLHTYRWAVAINNLELSILRAVGVFWSYVLIESTQNDWINKRMERTIIRQHVLYTRNRNDIRHIWISFFANHWSLIYQSLCCFNDFKMLANFTVFQTFSFLLFTILELFLNQLKVLQIVFIFFSMETWESIWLFNVETRENLEDFKERFDDKDNLKINLMQLETCKLFAEA